MNIPLFVSAMDNFETMQVLRAAQSKLMLITRAVAKQETIRINKDKGHIHAVLFWRTWNETQIVSSFSLRQAKNEVIGMCVDATAEMETE